MTTTVSKRDALQRVKLLSDSFANLLTIESFEDCILTNQQSNKVFWLLKTYDHENTIYFKGIDLMNFTTTILPTAYKFIIVVAIAKNIQTELFQAVLTLHGNSNGGSIIDRIIATDLYVTCDSVPLINSVFNINSAEKESTYALTVFECTNKRAATTLNQFFKDNQLHRNFFYLASNANLHFKVALQMLLDRYTNTFEVKHYDFAPSVAIIETLIDFKQMAEDLVCDDSLAIDRIFTPDGVYVYDVNRQKTTLLSNRTADLYKLVPIVSIDIETTAENMIDLPFGVNEFENIASCVLFCMHLNSIVIIVLYLKCQSDLVDWQKYNTYLGCKFQKIYISKYPKHFVQVYTFGSDTVQDWLFNYFSLYMKGGLFKYLNLQEDSIHFIVGHNQIKYDFLTLYTVMQWHNCTELLEHVEVEPLANSPVPVLMFNPHGIFIDTMIFFNEIKLYYGPLSLRAISKYFLKTNTKMDLNSIVIRIPYIVDLYLQKNPHEHQLKQRFCVFLKKFMRLTYAETEEEMIAAYRPVQLNLTTLPMELREVLSNRNLDMFNINLPAFDEMLHYNIRDTECVIQILQKINFTDVLHESCRTFNCNVANSVQDNISSRMRNLFNLESFKCMRLFTINGLEGSPKFTLFPCNLEYKNSIVSNARSTFVNGLNECEHAFTSNGVSAGDARDSFAGAAVGAVPGVYVKVLSVDVTSMYPTILWQKRLYINSTSTLNVRQMLELLNTTTELTRRAFEDALVSGRLKLIIAEDGIYLKLNKKKMPNYIELVKEWPFNYDLNKQNNFVGQVILNTAELEHLPESTSLLLTTTNSNSFIHKYIPKTIARRQQIKKMMVDKRKKCPNDEQLTRLDGSQLSLKININSLYGCFGNFAPAVSAATTLYGRKILIGGMKIKYVLILQFLSSIQKNEPNDELLLDYPDYEMNETRELLTKSGVDFNKFKYLTENLKCLYFIACLHATDCVQIIKRIQEYLNRFTSNEKKQQEFSVFMDTLKMWKLDIESIIVDFDTDGFQITNQYGLNTEILNNRFNAAMKEITNMPELNFEKAEVLSLILLTRKKYTTLKKGPVLSNLAVYKMYEKKWLPLQDFSIKHSGYERNALPHIKHICTVIACYVFSYYHQPEKNPLGSLEDVMFDIYTYLLTVCKKEDLYFNIRLQKIKPNCARKRFIEKYATNYQGSLNAVYVVNEANDQEETLLLFDDYCINPSKYKLHYGYFLRNYIKVWSVQLRHMMSSSQEYDFTPKHLHIQSFSSWLTGAEAEEGRRERVFLESLLNNKIFIA
ncbi:DNA polymerase DNA pol [Cotesia congregata filamentous virus 1]|uniref:DNA-directed DNA polymerase n=1 Tax=Cotesia congregata filamentous virus 1 TaxID=3064291 RepID=A0ABC8QJG6_9VIRU|nr:DNA polymerase DNA pol [Cotesia congregata filamentous virus 1]